MELCAKAAREAIDGDMSPWVSRASPGDRAFILCEHHGWEYVDDQGEQEATNG